MHVGESLSGETRYVAGESAAHPSCEWQHNAARVNLLTLLPFRVALSHGRVLARSARNGRA